MDSLASTLAAWWGAIVATFVLVWDVAKWFRGGPRLVVSAHGDRKMFISGRGPAEGEVVLISIKNRGRAATTITGLGMIWFRSKWYRFRKRSHSAYVVIVDTPNPIPHVLPPGQEWSGWFPQTREISEFARSGIIVLLVSSQHRDRDQRAVIQFSRSGKPIPSDGA